jgi:protein-S-isoprenylcysteine O-methyltransferase Ste14
MRRLLPPILFLICLVLMSLLRWLWPVGVFLRFPYNLAGLLPVVLGLGSGIAGAVTFRRARTNIRPFREADKLVTWGPFRFSRNPMYLGVTLVLVGSWLLMGVLSPLLGVLIFVITADRWYIAFEERMLQQKFGVEFETYRAKVRRWI